MKQKGGFVFFFLFPFSAKMTGIIAKLSGYFLGLAGNLIFILFNFNYYWKVPEHSKHVCVTSMSHKSRWMAYLHTGLRAPVSLHSLGQLCRAPCLGIAGSPFCADHWRWVKLAAPCEDPHPQQRPSAVPLVHSSVARCCWKWVPLTVLILRRWARQGGGLGGPRKSQLELGTRLGSTSTAWPVLSLSDLWAMCRGSPWAPCQGH